MKILFLVPYVYCPNIRCFRRNKTGFGMMVYNIINSISNAGEEVSVLTHCLTDRIQENHIVFERHSFFGVLKELKPQDIVYYLKKISNLQIPIKLKIRYLYYRIDARYAEKIIRKINPDVVHIHGLDTGTINYINVCKKLNIKYCVTAHGLIKDADGASHTDKKVEQTLFATFERERVPVSVISTGIKKRLMECDYYGLEDTDNIRVITNGIDTRYFEPSYNVREKYGLASDAKICIAVGSVYDGKNQIQIVRAFNQLDTDIQAETYVFIIGNIISGYPIEEEIKKVRLSNHIILTGFIPHEELCNYYAAADLTILASKVEGFGLSLVESFVYGKPCLTFSDIDSLEDIYDQNVMLVCKSRDDKDFANTIKLALLKNWDYSNIKEYSKKFSLDIMSNNYLNFYSDIVNNRL